MSEAERGAEPAAPAEAPHDVAQVASASTTRKAGRGLLVITGAKVYFILTSFGIQLALPHFFTPQVFGQFGTIMAAISMLNNVLIAATIQTVSKLVSEDEARGPAVLRQGIQVQLVIGGFLSAALFTLAPYFAQFHGDPDLAAMMRVAATVVLAYALYAALIGNLNGQQQFATQAKFDIGFSTLRTAGIAGGAMLGYGALGAFTGFAGAAGAICLAALLVVGIGKPGEGTPLRTWLAFLAPVWLYQGFLNGILQIDIQVLSRTLSELGREAGMAQAAASENAQTLVGYYRAAQTFAFVPYQIILSMTFIVFPMVSRATASGDEEAARRTIKGALRFSMLALLSIACPIAGASDGVMRIAYPEPYLAGAPALGALVFGIAAFALFVITATVLTSAGQPRIAALIAGLALGVVLLATQFFISAAGPNQDALIAAALGTCAGTVFALLGAGAAVYARFKAFLPPLSVVRGGLAGAGAFAAAMYIPHGGAVMSVAALAGGFFAFLLGLVVTGELGRDEIKAARAALGV
ncbi:MAG: oligosaccharide flippase family protein [Polyangiales bacterium]